MDNEVGGSWQFIQIVRWTPSLREKKSSDELKEAYKVFVYGQNM